MMMDVFVLLLSQLAWPLPHLIGNVKLYPDQQRDLYLDIKGNFPPYDQMDYRHLKDQYYKTIVIFFRVMPLVVAIFSKKRYTEESKYSRKFQKRFWSQKPRYLTNYLDLVFRTFG